MSALTIILLILCLASLIYLFVVGIVMPRRLVLPKITEKHIKITLMILAVIFLGLPAMLLLYYMVEYPLLALIAAPFIFLLPINK